MKNVFTAVMILMGHIALCQDASTQIEEKYLPLIPWVGEYGNSSYAVDITLTKKNIVEFNFESRSNKDSWLLRIDCSLNNITIKENTLVATGDTSKGETAKIFIYRGECLEIRWIIEVTGERSDFDYPYYRSGAGILSN